MEPENKLKQMGQVLNSGKLEPYEEESLRQRIEGIRDQSIRIVAEYLRVRMLKSYTHQGELIQEWPEI